MGRQGLGWGPPRGGQVSGAPGPALVHAAHPTRGAAPSAPQRQVWGYDAAVAGGEPGGGGGRQGGPNGGLTGAAAAGNPCELRSPHPSLFIYQLEMLTHCIFAGPAAYRGRDPSVGNPSPPERSPGLHPSACCSQHPARNRRFTPRETSQRACLQNRPPLLHKQAAAAMLLTPGATAPAGCRHDSERRGAAAHLAEAAGLALRLEQGQDVTCGQGSAGDTVRQGELRCRAGSSASGR